MLSESKIRIMKAIHNIGANGYNFSNVVLSESKIRIMKAIHNHRAMAENKTKLCSVSQR